MEHFGKLENEKFSSVWRGWTSGVTSLAVELLFGLSWFDCIS